MWIHCYTQWEKSIAVQLNVMAVTGFEPLSHGSPTQRLNQLSYLHTPSEGVGASTVLAPAVSLVTHIPLQVQHQYLWGTCLIGQDTGLGALVVRACLCTELPDLYLDYVCSVKELLRAVWLYSRWHLGKIFTRTRVRVNINII